MSLYKTLFWLLIFGVNAYAGKLKYPVPAGYLFNPPTYTIAQNSAALANEKGTFLGGQYEPSNNFGGNFVASSKVGFGVGYTEARIDTDGLADGLYGGVGANLGRISLGVSAVQKNIQSNFNPTFNFASVINAGGPEIGLFLFDVGGAKQPGTAIGFTNKQFSIEGSVLLPGLNQIGTSGSTYVFGLAGGLYGSVFGVSWETKYSTPIPLSGGTLTHTLSGSISLGQMVTFHARVFSTQAVVFGLTLGF